MRLVRTVAALSAVALLSAAGAALACSCLPFRSAAEQLDASAFVFKGRVTATKKTGDWTGRTSFRVTEVLKGPAVKTATVSHQISSASCGLEYEVGRTVWVFAGKGSDGRWRTGLCSTARFDEADYRRAARGEPVPTTAPVM